MGVIWSKYSGKIEYEDDSSFEEENDMVYDEVNEPNKIKVDQQTDDIIENICFDSATDTIDAAPPPTTVPLMLTLDQVMYIENELEVYEKVSVIYLLHDDVTAVLNKLLSLVNGGDEKLVYNWAINQTLKNQKWQEKLVEALCIIQNYQVLRVIGFDKEELNLKFVPQHNFTFLHINKIKKSLYFMCEMLDRKEVTHLIDLVCQDFKKKCLCFKEYSPQYLELYLLHWENVGYITQNDLTNLCNILKQMDQLDLYERLKQLTIFNATPFASQVEIPERKKCTDDHTKSKDVIDEILNPNSSLLQFASLESHISADNAVFVSSENKYTIDPEKPGVCLIINQENFYREIDPKLQNLLPPMENKLDSRTGTEHDKKKLETTFRHLGFKTLTVDNLIHSDILRKIEEVMMTVTIESSFFLCIMSHGDEGLVYGVNSCQVPVKAIKKIMVSKNRTHLAGKPKVLILQSCQGTRCQRISSINEDDDMVTDGPSSMISETVPPCADLFTFWATVPGFGAIRNKKTGSWFIQSLCEKMKTLRDKYHFEDICTFVVLDVSNKKWKQRNEDVAMVPQKDSTFRKLFYLPSFKN